MSLSYETCCKSLVVMLFRAAGPTCCRTSVCSLLKCCTAQQVCTDSDAAVYLLFSFNACACRFHRGTLRAEAQGAADRALCKRQQAFLDVPCQPEETRAACRAYLGYTESLRCRMRPNLAACELPATHSSLAGALQVSVKHVHASLCIIAPVALRGTISCAPSAHLHCSGLDATTT